MSKGLFQGKDAEKDFFESGSERKHLRLLPGKRANGGILYSSWIEDSPQFTAESFT
jgi:hypothetical protein